MRCPKCNAEMAEVAKHSVMIDHCTSCGGIWLDKGELGKIITQLREAEGSLDEEFHPLRDRHDSYHREHHHDEHYSKHRNNHHYKRKSAFGRLFDIFD